MTATQTSAPDKAKNAPTDAIALLKADHAAVSLAGDWAASRGASRLNWERARPAAREAWDRLGPSSGARA